MLYNAEPCCAVCCACALAAGHTVKNMTAAHSKACAALVSDRCGPLAATRDWISFQQLSIHWAAEVEGWSHRSNSTQVDAVATDVSVFVGCCDTPQLSLCPECQVFAPRFLPPPLPPSISAGAGSAQAHPSTTTSVTCWASSLCCTWSHLRRSPSSTPTSSTPLHVSGGTMMLCNACSI